MKARVKMMEVEAAKLREMQAEVEKSMNPEEGEREFRSPSKWRGLLTRIVVDKEVVDSRSVYVGNVSLRISKTLVSTKVDSHAS